MLYGIHFYVCNIYTHIPCLYFPFVSVSLDILEIYLYFYSLLEARQVFSFFFLNFILFLNFTNEIMELHCVDLQSSGGRKCGDTPSSVPKGRSLHSVLLGVPGDLREPPQGQGWWGIEG